MRKQGGFKKGEGKYKDYGPIHKWWLKLDHEQRARIAIGAQTTEDYLWQIAWGRRRAGPIKARLIAQAAEAFSPDYRITLKELRPDIWN